eukprot:6185025-Pleurochrysis_carterae.AAC.1
MLVRSRVRGSEIKLYQDCLGIHASGALRCVVSLYATNTALQSYRPPAQKDSERAEYVNSQPNCES